MSLIYSPRWTGTESGSAPVPVNWKSFPVWIFKKKLKKALDKQVKA